MTVYSAYSLAQRCFCSGLRSRRSQLQSLPERISSMFLSRSSCRQLHSLNLRFFSGSVCKIRLRSIILRPSVQTSDQLHFIRKKFRSSLRSIPNVKKQSRQIHQVYVVHLNAMSNSVPRTFCRVCFFVSSMNPSFLKLEATPSHPPNTIILVSLIAYIAANLLFKRLLPCRKIVHRESQSGLIRSMESIIWNVSIGDTYSTPIMQRWLPRNIEACT